MNILSEAEKEAVKEAMEDNDIFKTVDSATPTDLSTLIMALRKLESWFEYSKIEAKEMGMTEGDVERLAGGE